MATYKPFIKAKAVWVAGREKEINLTCAFTARFSRLQTGTLKITASCLCRAFLNGKLISYGPARAAHDFFRVDEIALQDLGEENFLLIEVAGYNCHSFYTINQPSFLQAEITDGEKVVAYTAKGAGGFSAYISKERLQKVARFSYQRAFTESYVFGSPSNKFLDYTGKEYPVEEVGYGTLLPRGVAYPTFEYQKYECCAYGKVSSREKVEDFPDWRFLVNENLGIIPKNQWEIDACDIAYNFIYTDERQGKIDALHEGEYAVFSNERSLTGFIETKAYAKENSLFYILFDEVDFREKGKEMQSGINVCFWRNDTLNIITYAVKKGDFLHLSFEAYTAKYIKVVVLKGELQNLEIGVRKFENPTTKKFRFTSADTKLNAIVEAARETLAQNAVDVLTDCPSRERAGWLCDSFFSGQAEKLFTGTNAVERNFLENYCLQSQKLGLPDGVLAMCYPADFADGDFIPNWMMFFILELGSYYNRTGDRTLVDMAFPHAKNSLKYFEKFENEYGLLENLEGWVFIEWSKANDAEFIKGVNFPTNMLYAKALETFGQLYHQKEALLKAEHIKEEIRRRSFNGRLFEDNLVRENGELKRMGHTSETCQYYAFYFGIADKERYPKLFTLVFDKLGPCRNTEKGYSDIFPSNAFIGNLLRLDYLLQVGRRQQFLDESKEYYYKMANTTGTLWEHNQLHCSLNHGFASYVAKMIVKCVSGFVEVDENKKLVYFSDEDVFLPCEIIEPVNSGDIHIICKDGKRKVEIPHGYTLMHK